MLVSKKASRKEKLFLEELYEGYRRDNEKMARKAATLWKQIGCPYEQALALFESNETDKRTALSIMSKLGAEAVAEKLKFEMRSLGIKSIPRGIRRSTRSNPANLTTRELDILQL